MNKQMAELDLIDFGAQSNLQYLATGSNFGQQLAELSTNIENMKSDTLNLSQIKQGLSDQIQKLKLKIDQLQTEKDGVLLSREAADMNPA